MDRIEYGVFLGPEDNEYSTLKTRATLCDKLGYDSLWVSDHLIGLRARPAVPRSTLQEPRPPLQARALMVAGGGERHTLKTAAKHADMTNYSAWVGTPDEFEHKTRILERHCQNEGRDPDEITKTWAAFVFIDERQEKAEETAKAFYTNRVWAMNSAAS